MTEREPFAVVRKEIGSIRHTLWLGGNPYREGLKKILRDEAKEINAAFNKRLDEEIAKVLGDCPSCFEQNELKAGNSIFSIQNFSDPKKAHAKWERGK